MTNIDSVESTKGNAVPDLSNPQKMASPAERRDQLLFAERNLKVGRRESSPENEGQQAKDAKRRIALGLTLACVVVIAAIVLVVALGSGLQIQ